MQSFLFLPFACSRLYPPAGLASGQWGCTGCQAGGGCCCCWAQLTCSAPQSATNYYYVVDTVQSSFVAHLPLEARNKPSKTKGRQCHPVVQVPLEPEQKAWSVGLGSTCRQCVALANIVCRALSRADRPNREFGWVTGLAHSMGGEGKRVLPLLSWVSFWLKPRGEGLRILSEAQWPGATTTHQLHREASPSLPQQTLGHRKCQHVQEFSLPCISPSCRRFR